MIYSNEEMKLFFKEFLLQKIAELNLDLTLDIVEIDGNLASNKYIQIKQKIGYEIGINVNLNKFDKQVLVSKVQDILDKAKSQNHGLIFQLPVPQNFQNLADNTPLQSDVDLLSADNYKLWNKGFLPPTIGAIDLILKQILSNPNLESHSFENFIQKKLDLSGKVVVVIGQGILVGAPLLTYLKNRQATIISLNKTTPEPTKLSKNADILICAAGSPNLVDTRWFNPKTIIIDASTSEVDGYLSGDIKPENIFETNLLCPSPGGIGAITVLYLFYNLLKLKLDLSLPV